MYQAYEQMNKVLQGHWEPMIYANTYAITLYM